MKLEIATNDFRDAAGIAVFCVELVVFIVLWSQHGMLGSLFALLTGVTLLMVGVMAIVVQSMHYGYINRQKLEREMRESG